MTKEQCINNYIDFILSNVKNIANDQYIDYVWRKRTYFWCNCTVTPRQPIIMNIFIESVGIFFAESLPRQVLFELICDRAKIFLEESNYSL